MRKLGVAVSLCILFTALDGYASCGVERWSIKTGTDTQAPSISLSTWISTTIYNMRSSTAPSSLPANSRIAPRETNQYSLGGTLIKYVREGDSDYHLVIKDGSGRTMIVEIPSINCVGAGSPFGPGISNARAQFDSRFTATSTMKSTSTAVTVRGIGFWDFIHGQTGVAPNGIEIHPVLNISIGGTVALAPGAPAIEDAGDGLDFGGALPATQYPDDMILDDDGGRVHVYRGGAGVGEVRFHGGAVLENPSIQMVFIGDARNELERRPFLGIARGFSADPRFAALWRYGVESKGISVDTREVPRPAQFVAASSAEMTDLDVQRMLADAVESGRLQHVDKETVYVVVLDRNATVAVGGNRDWMSYHSQFHPTELPMRYVVVRGDLDPATMREAVFASLSRTLVNPDGDGWF